MALPDPYDQAPEPKSERLEARLTARQKRLFQRAADLRGQSLTDFALNHLQEAAEKIIRECEILELTAMDSETLVEAFLNPPAPHENLRQAFQHYGQAFRF